MGWGREGTRLECLVDIPNPEFLFRTEIRVQGSVQMRWHLFHLNVLGYQRQSHFCRVICYSIGRFSSVLRRIAYKRWRHESPISTFKHIIKVFIYSYLWPDLPQISIRLACLSCKIQLLITLFLLVHFSCFLWIIFEFLKHILTMTSWFFLTYNFIQNN